MVREVPALSATGPGPVGTVLVEGESDARAVEALARRAGLDGASYVVVAMGGVTNVGRHLRELVDERPDALVAGLCDAGEVDVVARALTRSGFGRALDRWDLAALGFFVCEADLEDELLRALGDGAALEVVEGQGDLRSFHAMPEQAPHRDRPLRQRLRRFLGSGSGRKIRYAPLLVEALPAGAEPAPLAALVAHVARWGGG
ncbi:hypothetical protein FB458_2033 [Lapillicoccus jejuensis]|uniref:ATP-dependent endonuclease n=1 Tax=Lapillicoccus jejuensis TaxID=402171 RepID=A0A542E0R9_9MICO|nr:hypothetical protein FB458_2033 [Lapillicoccus jejuensis]